MLISDKVKPKAKITIMLLLDNINEAVVKGYRLVDIYKALVQTNKISCSYAYFCSCIKLSTRKQKTITSYINHDPVKNIDDIL